MGGVVVGARGVGSSRRIRQDYIPLAAQFPRRVFEHACLCIRHRIMGDEHFQGSQSAQVRPLGDVHSAPVHPVRVGRKRMHIRDELRQFDGWFCDPCTAHRHRRGCERSPCLPGPCSQEVWKAVHRLVFHGGSGTGRDDCHQRPITGEQALAPLWIRVSEPAADA